MLTTDPIERFLEDAEEAAKQGDRELALELLVLALDTAPPERSNVLVRAHAIRSMLPRPDARLPTPEAEPAASGVSPSRQEPSSSDAADAEDSEPSGLPGLDLPDIDQVVVSGMSREEEDEEAEMYSPTEVDRDDAELLFDPLLEDVFEDEDPSEAVEQERLRRTRYVRYVLWPVLAALLAGTLLFHLSPDRFHYVQQSIHQLFDPVVRAEFALERGDHARAEAAAQRLLAEERNVDLARMVLGKIALERGDVALAREHFNPVLAAPGEASWERLFAMGEAMFEAGETAYAADLHFEAFSQGAPWEVWVDIANVHRAASRHEQAATFYEWARRHAPEDAAAEDVKSILADTLDFPGPERPVDEDASIVIDPDTLELPRSDDVDDGSGGDPDGDHVSGAVRNHPSSVFGLSEVPQTRNLS